MEEKKYNNRPEYKICDNCGNRLHSDDTFCDGCGVKVERREAEAMDKVPSSGQDLSSFENSVKSLVGDLKPRVPSLEPRVSSPTFQETSASGKAKESIATQNFECDSCGKYILAGKHYYDVESTFRYCPVCYGNYLLGLNKDKKEEETYETSSPYIVDYDLAKKYKPSKGIPSRSSGSGSSIGGTLKCIIYGSCCIIGILCYIFFGVGWFFF